MKKYLLSIFVFLLFSALFTGKSYADTFQLDLTQLASNGNGRVTFQIPNPPAGFDFNAMTVNGSWDNSNWAYGISYQGGCPTNCVINWVGTGVPFYIKLTDPNSSITFNQSLNGGAAYTQLDLQQLSSDGTGRVTFKILNPPVGFDFNSLSSAGASWDNSGWVYAISYEGGCPDACVVDWAGQSTTPFYVKLANDTSSIIFNEPVFPVLNTPPSINALTSASINKGDTYSTTGSFTDADSTSWTATVDYGDGSGVQPLSLSSMNFALQHVYSATGTYTATVAIMDNQGVTATATANVTVGLLPPTSLHPMADAYIKDGSQNENEGASTFLRIQSSGHNRALVDFDEQAIKNAVGNDPDYTATLRFTISDNGNNWGSTGRTIDIHRLTSAWAEGNGFIVGNTPSYRGTGAGVTWNCAIDTNIANQSADCNGSTAWNMSNSSLWPFAAIPTDTQTITNNQSGTVSFDVTADVQSFVHGSSQNDGWIIKKTNEGQNGMVEFGSKESATSPQLLITPL